MDCTRLCDGVTVAEISLYTTLRFSTCRARCQPRAPRSTSPPTPWGRGSGSTWRTSRIPRRPHPAAPCTCSGKKEVTGQGKISQSDTETGCSVGRIAFGAVIVTGCKRTCGTRCSGCSSASPGSSGGTWDRREPSRSAERRVGRRGQARSLADFGTQQMSGLIARGTGRWGRCRGTRDRRVSSRHSRSLLP